jgi:hypothetical protein
MPAEFRGANSFSAFGANWGARKIKWGELFPPPSLRAIKDIYQH